MSVTLQTVSSGYNLSAINANFQSLQTALNNNILWRTGDVAGEGKMSRDLDMDGNAILNIGVDVDNPGSLLTLEVADERYYNVSGDVLEGPMDANTFRLTNLGMPLSPNDAARKGELDSETLARQTADANLQEQMTGTVPLEASAFSQISWHSQDIPNSVTIPADKNAWSFGPQMEITPGQLVTIGSNSFWTIANGRVVEAEDLHHLIADSLTTTDGSVTVQVSQIADASDIAGLQTQISSNTSSISSLNTRMGAEETKVQSVALGGTGATTASAARTNLGLGTIATQAASSVAITGGSITGITDLAVADGGTGASTATAARTNLGAAASGVNADITQLTGLNSPSPLQGVTDASSAAAGKIGQMVEANASAISITSGAVSNITSISLPAGEWDVYGEVQEVFSAAGAGSSFNGAISTTSATNPGFPYVSNLNCTVSGTVVQFPTPRRFLQLSATTTVYLVASAVFGSGTCTAAGYIHARRIR